jgi:transposase
MPWRECSVMDERVRFIGRLLDGEAMSELCREFGISRKTGYKIFNRYRQDGVEALTDRSRRPVRHANQLPDQVEAMIVRLKREKPHWGARKLRELLVRRLSGDIRVPAKSTVHAVLDRHGLVKRARQRRRFTAQGTALSAAIAPTICGAQTSKANSSSATAVIVTLSPLQTPSRMLLACEALETTKEDGVFKAFKRLFAERGLPNAIRSDNGLPFASPNGLYNLSKLSVWCSGWASAWSALNPDIRSKTDAMSACI